MSYVEINSIHKSFNNIKVLKDIDFSIEKSISFKTLILLKLLWMLFIST